MKVYQSDKIRNIALLGHQGAGKTSLVETIAYNAGITKRLGKVVDGNSVGDYFPEEIKRKITISTSLVACEWNEHKINLLDTPGFTDFYGEIKSSLRVADCVLMVFDAVPGVQVSHEILWDSCDEKKIPIIAYISKVGRENTNYFKVLDDMNTKLTRLTVPVVIPIGKEEDFCGLVDLINEKAYLYKDGVKTEVPIPEDMVDEVAEARGRMIDAAAEGDDELTIKYLDGESLTHEEVKRGIREGIINGRVVPVLCGSSTRNIGSDILMDFFCEYAPSPLQFLEEDAVNKPATALVYKTVADPFVGKQSFFKVMQGRFIGDKIYRNTNKDVDEKVGPLSTMQGKTLIPVAEVPLGDIGVVSKLVKTGTGETLSLDATKVLDGIKFPTPTLTVAIAPKAQGDDDKMGTALARILEEDKTLVYAKNNETKQFTLTGMGDTHIDVILERFANKFGVEVEIIPMRFQYREAIKGKASHVEGKHKKQSGGHGQYGHVFIDLEPCYDDKFVFEEKVFGGAVPKSYFPAVEKGVQEVMAEGLLAGYPITNVKVTLLDGSYHPVDSSEMAFKIAAATAFKKAFEMAKPILLEPVMNLTIWVPDEYMGDIMAGLNTRRGRIMGMEKDGKYEKITAQAPFSELTRYTIDLRSKTQGRGRFSMEFADYEEVPAMIAEKIIEAHKAEREKDKE